MAVDGDRHAVLKEGGAVADHVTADGHLLVGLAVHEDQIVAIVIQEGAFKFLEDDPLDRFRRPEPLIQLGPVADVTKFDLGEGAALAGLHMLNLDRAPQPPVMFDDIAGFDGVAVQFHLQPRRRHAAGRGVMMVSGRAPHIHWLECFADFGRVVQHPA